MSLSNTKIYKFDLSTGQNEHTATINDVTGNCQLLNNKINNELYFIDMWGTVSVYDKDLNLKYTDDIADRLSDYSGNSEEFRIDGATIDNNGCVYITGFYDDTQDLIKLDNSFNVEFVMDDELNDLGFQYWIASLKDGRIVAYNRSQNETLVDIIDISSEKVSERYEIEQSDGEWSYFGKSNGFDWIKLSRSSCDAYVSGNDNKVVSYNSNDEICDLIYQNCAVIDDGKLYSIQDSQPYSGEMINVSRSDKCSKIYNDCLTKIMSNGNIIGWDNHITGISDYSAGIIRYTPDGDQIDPIYPDGMDISDGIIMPPSIIGCGEKILINYNGKYKLYDTEGRLISEFEFGDLFCNVIYIEYNDESFMCYSKDEKFYMYNIQNKNTDTMDIINDNINPGNATIYTGNSYYDLYFLSEYSFYGYDIGSQTLTEIISDTRTLGIDDISKIIVAGDDGTLLCMTGNEGDNLYILTPSENGDTRTVINVAYVNAECHEEVQKFNDNSEDYVINATEYRDVSELNLDIAAGKIPDIMISDGGYYVKELAEKNMFTDMSAFFKNDKEIKTDDYLENMLSLYKSGDITYQVFPSFGFKSVFTDDKVSDIKWDYDGFLDYAEQYGSKALYGDYDKCGMLLEFMPYYFADFVDIKNKSCSFDNQTFRDILKLINAQECYGNYDKLHQISSIYDGYGATYVSRIRSFSEFENLNNGNKTKISIKGFPGKEEGHSQISPDICFSISESCENKETAWSFIRTFFLNDYQNLFAQFKMDGIPVKKSAYNDLIQKQKSDGKKSYTELDNAIKSIKMSYDSQNSINKIISEETSAYFEGAASEDDVIAALQNKVKLYLNEKY